MKKTGMSLFTDTMILPVIYQIKKGSHHKTIDLSNINEELFFLKSQQVTIYAQIKQ